MVEKISVTQRLAELLREKYAGYKVFTPLTSIKPTEKKITSAVKLDFSEKVKDSMVEEGEVTSVDVEEIKNPYVYNLYIDNLANKLLEFFGIDES